MSWQSSAKNLIISSHVAPAVYSLATKPFAKKLRHLKDEKLPEKFKKVTAVVPNYNYARFLPRRIESILSQTYPVSELIILDDASTDDSDEVIKSLIKKYQKEYKNIRFIYRKNKENTGKPIVQWKKAFRLSSGNFIWICEADDYCDNDFLASLMPTFEKDKDVVLAYSNSVAVNTKNRILSYDFAMHSGKLKNDHWRRSYIADGKKEIEEFLKYRCTIPNVSAVVFRNKTSIPFLKYLSAAEEFAQVGDWYFYLKVLSHGKIAFKKSARNFFRIGRGSVTAKSKNTKNLEEEIDWIHKHFEI